MPRSTVTMEARPLASQPPTEPWCASSRFAPLTVVPATTRRSTDDDRARGAVIARAPSGRRPEGERSGFSMRLSYEDESAARIAEEYAQAGVIHPAAPGRYGARVPMARRV